MSNWYKSARNGDCRPSRTGWWLYPSFMAVLIAAPLLGLPLHDEFGNEVGTFLNLQPRHTVPPEWRPLAEGFETTVLKFEGENLTPEPPRKLIKRKVELLVYRIDPKVYPVKVVTARKALGQKTAYLSQVHKKTGALLTINGGFFHKEGDPVGLVITDGKKIHDYDEEGGSGVFAVYGKTLRIGWAQNLAGLNPLPDHALQNGPLIVEPGGAFGIIHIRIKFYPRTILGLDKQNRLLVGVTRKMYDAEEMSSGLNLFEAAAIFYQPENLGGLGSTTAINMDGGTSTGMEISVGKHVDRVKVGIELPNFVCIMPPESLQ